MLRLRFLPLPMFTSQCKAAQSRRALAALGCEDGCAKYDIFRIGMNLCPRRDQWRVKCKVFKIEKTQEIKSLEHGSAQTLSHDVDETVEHSFGSIHTSSHGSRLDHRLCVATRRCTTVSCLGRDLAVFSQRSLGHCKRL